MSRDTWVDSSLPHMQFGDAVVTPPLLRVSQIVLIAPNPVLWRF